MSELPQPLRCSFEHLLGSIPGLGGIQGGWKALQTLTCFPELTLANNLAVVTGTFVITLVIPGVMRSDSLAVPTFIGDSQVD